jgi:signal peptidase I
VNIRTKNSVPRNKNSRPVLAEGSKLADELMVGFRGRSMQPTLRPGMQLLVVKVLPQDIRLADIILYRQAGSLVCHRVIKILRRSDKRIFVTKADNHAYVDASFVVQKDLLGRVTAAFSSQDLRQNILVKNRLVDWLYLILGNLVLFFRRYRRHVPSFFRDMFKVFVGGFFFIFKNLIHFIYLRLKHEYMFSRGKRS